MAATDQTYRHQKTLDIVFAVSCVLMLASIIWMFAQDYFREFKQVQRDFRDVEEALAERNMLERMPDPARVEEAADRVAQARANLDKIKKELPGGLNKALYEKARAEARYQSIKADYDSFVSLYNEAIDQRDEAADEARRKALEGTVEKRRQDVQKLEKELVNAQVALDSAESDVKTKQTAQKEAETELSRAEDNLKKVSGEFDRFAKLTAQKSWKASDWVRKLPVLDAFASPVKIQQFTLTDYPIDYSFKYVTRYDRCTTCHLGIDRPTFDKESLRKLTPDNVPDGLQERLEQARALYQRRVAQGENVGFDPGDLPKEVVTAKLTSTQVNEYCAHPRLDLFVDPNSPHPAEKFGCTSCHSGQGSATDFALAVHAPNNPEQRQEWIKNLGWEHNHFWDYPMLPKRFIESTCLKCHHQVTDLIRMGNKEEAPKLIKGYNLVKDLGCFGCHEILGMKGTREIGPDLRLEPSPPVDAYSPADRVKLFSDPLNPPGTERKVGPSLYRLSEKTNQQWARKWIAAPRNFRPTTKMPHFFGLSNNSKDVLPDDQKVFPDTEIASIAYYLTLESKEYLDGSDKYNLATQARAKELRTLRDQKKADEPQLRELEELERRLQLEKKHAKLTERMVDGDGRIIHLPPVKTGDEAKQQLSTGRQLFSERGCLACHIHNGTTKTDDPKIPVVTSVAPFGPDLSRLAAKIAPEMYPNDPEAKRRWLVQWLLNPNIHFPRTHMPITHLTVEQADAIAAWLLAQPVSDWDQENVPDPKPEALAALAKVYLLKAPGMTREDADEILSGAPNARKGIIDVSPLPADADERQLQGPLTEDKLKWYVGRKAIARQGCYACHEIPGFASAKPVGTQLHEWGKKDPERLAFEDIIAYVREKYQEVPEITDDKGNGVTGEASKPPYEAFFLEALEQHEREGFLHQKLVEPRSYDFHRMRSWDERLRMPQFRFAHGPIKPRPGETMEQATVREEAEGREAVMTFILGLVADPVPASYLNQPGPDRLAEVKGRKVLDKYNCAGCHELRPGVYEFKNNPNTIKRLEDNYETASASFAADHAFANSNAWVGQPSRYPDRLTAYGIPLPENDDPKTILLRLTRALRFTNTSKETRDLPASSTVEIPVNEVVAQAGTLGGTFARLLVPYLMAKDRQTYNDPKNARAALPPPLEREGEKVQPVWLFQFLRNPQAIRPVTVLRMPRFNMSDEEAMALVNYFAAIDRMDNPAEGLNYPYLAVPQRDELFWQEKTQSYLGRIGKAETDARLKGLQPTWELLLHERILEAERKLQNAEATVKVAKDDALTTAQKQRDDLKKELDKLKAAADKKDFKSLDQAWLEKEAYPADAYRLLANYNTPCLSCHQAGNLPYKAAQGPPLDLAWERLRPEWTLRWLASPDRMISYPTPMPQNFARNAVDAKGNSTLTNAFPGTPMQQVEATRDLLMALPKIADLPVDRYYQPAASAGGK